MPHSLALRETLRETVIASKGRPFYDRLDKDVKKEITDIDNLRRWSEKKKISFQDPIPA